MGEVTGRVQLKRDGTRWRTDGEVKRKLTNGVGSQNPSHYLATWCIHLDAYTSAASRRLNWCPCRFKWTRPFRRKTKSGFCACAITFQTQSTTECLTLYPRCCTKWVVMTEFNPLLFYSFLFQLIGL